MEKNNGEVEYGDVEKRSEHPASKAMGALNLKCNLLLSKSKQNVNAEGAALYEEMHRLFDECDRLAAHAAACERDRDDAQRIAREHAVLCDLTKRDLLTASEDADVEKLKLAAAQQEIDRLRKEIEQLSASTIEPQKQSVTPASYLNYSIAETSETMRAARAVLLEIDALLASKNARYGDSALHPVRIFSRADAVEQLRVRIDDKLSRIRNQNGKIEKSSDEDTALDLAGYLVLYLAAMRGHGNAEDTGKDVRS